VSYERNPRAVTVHEMFGRRVKREREKHGWSARELGRRAGLSDVTIGSIEAGGGTRLGCAVVICAALGVSLDAMTGPAACDRCDGMPTAGYRCRECGTEGKVPA
jgi:transcriptional regulator with XRE-family HTH domain